MFIFLEIKVNLDTEFVMLNFCRGHKSAPWGALMLPKEHLGVLSIRAKRPIYVTI